MNIFFTQKSFPSKVRKTQHQNLEFGPKSGEIKNKPVKKYISIQVVKWRWGQGEFQNTTIFCGKLSFIVFWPPLSFFLSASTAATYIFTAPSCTTIIITLEPCALNAEFQQFIPRFNEISLVCSHHSKRGIGMKGGPKTGWLYRKLCRVGCKVVYHEMGLISPRNLASCRSTWWWVFPRLVSKHH